MGRLLTGIGIVAVALGVLASTTSASVSRPARANCRAKALTFLFWPSGHNAIPSINFPSFLYPHLEVYKTAAAYPDQNFLAGIGFGPSGQPYGGISQSCTKVKSNKIINSKPAAAKTDQATSLQCNFPKQAQLEVVKLLGTPVTEQLNVVLPSKTSTAPLQVSVSVVDASPGSTMRFNPKYCKAYPPPH